MKKLTRKLSSIVALTLVLCMVMSVPVFAAEPQTNSEVFIINIDEPVRAQQHTLDSGSQICNSGISCTITLHLYSSYYMPYFRAGAAGNSNNYVNCMLTTPTGATFDLGSIMANGSVTPYLYINGWAGPGDYIFEFQGTNSGPTGFAAFIYADY